MIVVATTLTTFAMDRPEVWGSWLTHAEHMIETWPDGVQFFAAIETDARGLDPFEPLLDRLRDIDGTHWEFRLDDGRTHVTTANRLRHIVAGQNLCNDFCCSIPSCTHLLFMAGDCEPDPDTLPKLTEVEYPVVGGHVPTYCLTGPLVDRFPYPVRQHMPTAAYVMLDRFAFRRLRWRWDLDAGMTDDPCLAHDAEVLGYPPLVRHDCVGRHHPETIPAIEERGYNLSVARESAVVSDLTSADDQ